MKKRWISFLLVLSMILTLASVAAFAEGYQDPVQENGVTIKNPNTSFSNRRDLVLDKTLTANKDGTFDLKLETYATGKVTTSVKTTQIPTDFICVVDQSGSMAYQDMPTDFQPANHTGSWKLSDFEGGKDTDGNSADKEYYFYDQNTGDYYRVYRKWGDVFERVPRNTVYCKSIVDSRNLTWFADEKGTESDFDSQYYYQPASDINITRQCATGAYIQPGGENDYNFYPLTISSQGRTLYYSIRLNYNDSTGTKRYLRFTNNNANTTANKDKETGACIWYRNPSGGYFGPGDRYLAIMSYNAGIGIDANDFVINWIDGNANWDSFYTYGQITSAVQSGMYIQNTMFIRHVNYNALAYRDANGVEHVIASTDYCDGQGTPTSDQYATSEFSFDAQLYEAKGDKETRLQAAKNALNAFVANVAGQTDDNGPVDHRIAIVGFSSSGYNNTELLTNSERNIINGTNGIQKTSANNDDYAKALVNARTDNGDINSYLTNGIAALTASGGTQPEDGLDMAYSILDKSTKKNEYSAKTRNAVVIFFTDGRPGNYHDSDQYKEANDVVASAWNIKRDIPEAQIYSIGVFGEADGNPLTHHIALSTWYGDVTRNYMEKDRLEEDRVAAGADGWDVNSGNGYANPSSYYNYRDYAENIYKPEFYKENGTHDTVTVRYRHRDWVWQDYSYKYVTAYTHTISGTYWRECVRNAEGYPAQQNDTIADYMTVVSSTYPGAKTFTYRSGNIDGFRNYTGNDRYNTIIGNARSESTKVNKMYYSLCTDSQRLTDVFVNIAESIDTAGSTIDLDESAQLQDIVNTDVFKMPANAGDVTAYAVSASARNENGNIIYTFGTDHEQDFIPTVNPDGTISVSGFDYSAHYVMEKPPAGITGQKLVLEIKNLELKTIGDELKSNNDAGIYAVDNETGEISTVPTLDIESPKFDASNAYFAVHHIEVDESDRSLSEADTTVYPVKDYVNTTFDITDETVLKSGYLYGGIYEGFDKDTGKLGNAITNECGKELTPTPGKSYYVKEVPDAYLQTKTLYRGSGPNLVRSYLVSAVDSEEYYQTGFEVNDADKYRDDNLVYRHVIITDGPIAGSGASGSTTTIYVSSAQDNTFEPNSDGNFDLTGIKIDEKNTIGNVTVLSKNVKQAFAGTSGYLSMYSIPIQSEAQNATAYWVTHDGVKVTGTNVRKVVNGRKSGDDTTVKSVCTKYGTEDYSENLTVQSMFVGASDVDEEEVVDTGVKLAGYTTSLNGNIAMNFYMDLSDEAAADKDAYMQFTLPGTNHTEEIVKLADAKKQVRGGKSYYVFSAGVAAKDMTSDIKAQFVKGDGTKSEVWTYTIKEYCDYIRSHPESYDKESVALVENMLNYGGYAQTYFKHNTDKMANADLDLTLPEVSLDASFDPVISGEAEGLTYKGSSAMLTTTTGLRHYFELTGDASDYTFKANGAELKLQSDKNNSYVLIDNIKAKDLKKPISLTVTDKNGNTMTLKYSVYSNIKQVVGNDQFDANSQNLMKALYGYGEAANEYFATR